MSKQALLIFTKNAEKGKVKTRLAAAIGIEEAFAVNQKLVDHTIDITGDLQVDKFVFYSDFIPEVVNQNYQNKIQQGTSLGERMSRAFAAVFQKGYEKAVIIGTDCPELNAEIIITAFARLEEAQVVIGPAADGGYYLIGMKENIPQVFEGIFWSTETVFNDTLSICKRNNLTYSLLPVLHDVDEEKDLMYMQSIIN